LASVLAACSLAASAAGASLVLAASACLVSVLAGGLSS